MTWPILSCVLNLMCRIARDNRSREASDIDIMHVPCIISMLLIVLLQNLSFLCSIYNWFSPWQVHGERGNLVCENPQSPVFLSGVSGRTTSYLHPSFPTRYQAAYKLELNHFINSILDPGKPLLINREDVLLSSRVANACERSYKEGRMVPLEPAPAPQEVDAWDL